MHRCLDLASLGRGKVGNGALVGAVLVRNSRIIAEGFHAAYGAPHAERALLEAFSGEVAPEDVLYVNLEPCCHQGKTPPCTDILLQRGVKTVVYGMRDPDARVAGKGIALLQQQAVNCILSTERAVCEKLNTGFIQVRRTSRPSITLKRALTSDGRTCKHDGSPLKITSPEQDAWSHTFLRARHDAILVGVGTIISDNPSLSIRFDQTNKISLALGLNEDSKNTKNSFQPHRIILDPAMRTPESAKVVSDGAADRTIIIVEDLALRSMSKKSEQLRERGALLFPVPLSGQGFHWPALWETLVTPREGFHGLTSILVEGGARTWKFFRDARAIDQEVTLLGS